MNEAKLLKQIEFLHRRMVRAKQIVESGGLVVAQGRSRNVFVCASTSSPKRYYLVGKSCACPDRFRFNGKKLCKHVLAKMLYERNDVIKAIGAAKRPSADEIVHGMRDAISALSPRAFIVLKRLVLEEEQRRFDALH